MDTDFLALAERPVAVRRIMPFTTVIFPAFTNEQVKLIRSTMVQLDVQSLDARLEHHGLEIDFANDADAALVKLAIPPLR